MRNLRTEQEIMANWKGDISNPLVSISCITYNHEQYIEDALEGFLIQETNFPFEILIHDDASIDRTADIIREYEAKFSNLIKPIYQTENQYSQGKKPNTEFNLPRAKGEYIALCEGDDYWTAPYKLQKQVDFLELNKEYSMCFHNAIVNDKVNKKTYYFNGKEPIFNPKKLNLDRTINGYELLDNWIVPTASVIYHSKHITPIDFQKTYYGDIVLFLYLSKQGEIYYFNETLSVYRKLEQGIRNIYKKEVNGFLEHYKNLQINFKDIKYLSSSCEKYKSILYFHKGWQEVKNGKVILSLKSFYMHIVTHLKFILSPKASSTLIGSLFILKNCLKKVLS